ncbi:MAG: sulfatase [Planctomycetes bacterium]|nr:sulfatase [Planctomycetota bacterium]
MNTSLPRVRGLALAALAAVLANACEHQDAPERPSIVLISIDSLRPDHLGCYGYAPPTSPTIDAVAAEGVRFETALSTTSWTLPSHAAMFTGLFDSAHGLFENGLALSPEHQTLAELLKSEGYQTAGFFGGPYLHPTYGLDQGFEYYQSCMTQLADDLTPEQIRDSSRAHFGPSHRDITSPRTVDEVRKWLTGADDRPFFAFVHLWDVHYDYIPHKGLIELFDADYQGGLKTQGYMANEGVNPGMDPRDLAHVLALYDNEIRFTDDHIKELLELLEWKADGKENLIVVITADHGEEFFEHGNKGHQHGLFDEVVKVPMVLRWPGHAPAGKVVGEQVRLIDLLPTLASAGGAPTPAHVQGRDLLPLVAADQPVPKEPALLELLVAPYQARLLRTESFKAGQASFAGRPGVDFGYRLDSDAGEHAMLGGDDSDVKRALDGMHRLVRGSQAINRELGAGPTRVKVDPALEKRLGELGYVDAAK